MIQVGKQFLWVGELIPNLHHSIDPHSTAGQSIINREGFNTSVFSGSCGALEGIILQNPVDKVWKDEVWFKGGVRVDLTKKIAVKWNGKPFHNRFAEALVRLAVLARQNWKEFL